MLVGLLEGNLVTYLVNCTEFLGQKVLHFLFPKKGFEPDGGTGFVFVTDGKLSIDISVGRPTADSA